MRILIIGAGVLGCNIAANLYRTKKDVTLLARNNWYAVLKENGLKIKNRFTPVTRTYRIRVIPVLKPDDIYDLIIVSLRFTQLQSLYDTLNQNGSKNILFNGNNTRTQDTADRLPGKNVMFSFSLSAGHREKYRVNSIDLKKITAGDLSESSGNEQMIRDVFETSGYRVVWEKNIKDYLLSHAAFVVPVAFACYETGGDLKKIRRNDAYIRKIIAANQECNEALEKTGHVILPEEDQEFRTKKWVNLVFRFYKLMCSTSLSKLLASDHALNAADEMQALALDMKTILIQSGVPYPYFDELWPAIDPYLENSGK